MHSIHDGIAQGHVHFYRPTRRMTATDFRPGQDRFREMTCCGDARIPEHAGCGRRKVVRIDGGAVR